jgi:hypothetical protein
MFSEFERQGKRQPLPIIYVSNRDDQRLKEHIEIIAKQKNKLPNKVTDQEIINYLKDNNILFIYEETEKPEKLYERFFKWFKKD